MERVAFLVERTNQRLGCLLNPEQLVIRRTAGIHPRQGATGVLTGAGLSDDPLIFTGGGRTELELSLLFDVSLAGSSVVSADIRDLTAPLWQLAENPEPDAEGRPPLVRFIWGKAWNIPGVIVAVAERLEHFTPGGVPQRSWLRLRMWRTPDADLYTPAVARPLLPESPPPETPPGPVGGGRVHPRLGGGPGLAALPPEAAIGEAVVSAADLIAATVDTNPAGARLLAACRRIGELAGDALAELAALPAAETDPQAVAAVGGFFSSMAEIGRSVLSEAKHRVVAAASAASVALHTTLAAADRRVRQVTGPIGQALAGLVARVDAQVRPLARTLAHSAAAVAQAVRVRAARMVAAALPYVEAGRTAVLAGLDRAKSFVAPAAAEAAAAVREVMDDVGRGLAELRAQGITAPFAGVAAALGRIGPVLAALWAAGQRRTARVIQATVPKLVRTIGTVLEAGAAMAAVAGRQTRAAVAHAVDAVRQALAATGAERGEAIQSAAHTLAASLEAASLTAPSGVWQAAAARYAELAPRLAAAAATPVAPTEIAPALDDLTAALDQVDAAETEAAAQLTHQTLAAPAASPDSRFVAAGERLDQLAYQYYGRAAYWRVLAAASGVDDPLRLPTGLLVQVAPPAPGGTA